MSSTTPAAPGTSTSASDEALFLSYIEGLKSLPVVFSDNYQAPPDQLPPRIAVLNLEVLPPPQKAQTGSTNLADVLNVTFKSLKPAYSVTLPIHPADSILSLKNLLSSQSAGSSPLAGSAPAQQRLLLKGKALGDSKLVKDYDIKEGSVITVMMSASKPAPPSIPTDQAATAGSVEPMTASPAVENSTNEPSLSPNLTTTGHKRRISDIPAVTLSPAGTPGATTPLLQPTTTVGADPLAHIPLTPQSPPSPILKIGSIPIDLTSIPIPTAASVDDSPYHHTMADPQFWKELRGFLSEKFGKDVGGRTGDADKAFEEFLRSAKVNLSPHEIAKIRDEVGITGMGGS